MAFTRVGDFMAAVTRQLGLDEQTPVIVKIWESELGPLAAQAKLVGIKDGILIVEVPTSVLLQELSLYCTSK